LGSLACLSVETQGEGRSSPHLPHGHGVNGLHGCPTTTFEKARCTLIHLTPRRHRVERNYRLCAWHHSYPNSGEDRRRQTEAATAAIMNFTTSSTPDATKGARYLGLLDQALCNGEYGSVPELARKVDKHAPERKGRHGLRCLRGSRMNITRDTEG
jgi:hypothetical protein